MDLQRMTPIWCRYSNWTSRWLNWTIFLIWPFPASALTLNQLTYLLDCHFQWWWCVCWNRLFQTFLKSAACWGLSLLACSISDNGRADVECRLGGNLNQKQRLTICLYNLLDQPGPRLSGYLNLLIITSLSLGKSNLCLPRVYLESGQYICLW